MAGTLSRGEISTPIVAILVTVAALAVTGIAIAWMTKVGFTASQQGILTIIGTATVSESGSDLYVTFTVKNLGTKNATMYAIQVGGSKPITIGPGFTTVYVDGELIAGTPVIPAGDQAHVVTIVMSVSNIPADVMNSIRSKGTTSITLHTDQGSISFSAYYLGA